MAGRPDREVVVEPRARARQGGGRVGGVRAGIDRWQRGRPWVAFPVAVARKFADDQGGHLAALVAYYGFFSLFPLLLALVTVLGFALEGDPGLRDRVLDSALGRFPVIGDEIGSSIGALDGSVPALVIGLAGALWAGLGALRAMELAQNEVWDVPIRERPRFVEATLRSLAMLGVLGLGLVAVVVLGGAATLMGSLGPLATVAGAATALVVATGVFLLAYVVLTDRDVGWRAHLPGAVVAAVGFVALQVLGGYYVRHVVQGAGDTYGLFAVVLGLLSWMHLQARVALLGSEVNVVRAAWLWPRGLDPGALAPADERALRRSARVEERHPAERVDVSLDLAEAHDREAHDRDAHDRDVDAGVQPRDGRGPDVPDRAPGAGGVPDQVVAARRAAWLRSSAARLRREAGRRPAPVAAALRRHAALLDRRAWSVDPAGPLPGPRRARGEGASGRTAQARARRNPPGPGGTPVAHGR